MIYPHFFIGGAQKCGTTSLAVWLNEHPELQCSEPKEPNFFSNRALAELKQDYSSFYSKNSVGNLLRFEATTSYMTDKTAMENIKRILGEDVKFIFILKDPVKRAVSAYYHLFKHFAEKRELEEVFSGVPADYDALYEHESAQIQEALERKTINIIRYRNKYDNYTWAYRYLSNSLYSKHIKYFEQSFGKDNVLCLHLGKFRTDPASEFLKITDFLGVSAFEKIPDTQTAHNKTKIPSYLYNQTIRQNEYVLATIRSTHKLYRRVTRKTCFAAEPKPLRAETQESLCKLFEKEFDFLSTL